jgi:hypothetical protein
MQDLFNPSYISLENFGLAIFDLSMQGVKVGEAHIPNFG